ncbi:MAG: hypothetical protein ACOZNI_27905 [Myxococcota bacterium]
MTELWTATATAFERAMRPLLDRGIRVERMGPFDTKGPVWCASRPGSPDVFLWTRRIGPSLHAFAGTASKPTKDVEFLNPLVFRVDEWITQDGMEVGEALALAVEAALTWADDHVPPALRGG